MAQCYMGSLTFLAVQESVQWDLRSLYSDFHVVVVVVFLILVLVPIVQLLRRAGHNPACAYSPSFPS